MSVTTIFLLVAAVWIGTGIFLSLVLGRRGHDGFSWFLVGMLLGPLAIVLGLDAWRREEPAQRRTLAAGAAPEEVQAGGAVDVLVGFDGSPESRAVAGAATDLLGTRLGRLTLATVVPYDGGREAERDAVAGLEQEAGRLPLPAPGLVVLRGHPARALAAEAAAGGYDLLAIGTRGAGHAHLFGSAASELVHDAKVPIFMVGSRR